MQFRNSNKGYGLTAIAIHWIFALAFIGLFGTGIYMVELTYYDSLYKTLPDLHRSTGVVLAGLLFYRLIWRATSTQPEPEPTLKNYEILGAELVHWALYLLPLAIMISGYLITTADGSSIDVFGIFEMPAILPAQKGREDIAGDIHFYLAYATIGIVLLHTLAALKHHFLDHDKTLIKMFKTTD